MGVYGETAVSSTEAISSVARPSPPPRHHLTLRPPQVKCCQLHPLLLGHRVEAQVLYVHFPPFRFRSHATVLRIFTCVISLNTCDSWSDGCHGTRGRLRGRKIDCSRSQLNSREKTINAGLLPSHPSLFSDTGPSRH